MPEIQGVSRPTERENWIACIKCLIRVAREHHLTSVCYAVDCEFLLEELEKAEKEIQRLNSLLRTYGENAQRKI